VPANRHCRITFSAVLRDHGSTVLGFELVPYLDEDLLVM